MKNVTSLWKLSEYAIKSAAKIKNSKPITLIAKIAMYSYRKIDILLLLINKIYEYD